MAEVFIPIPIDTVTEAEEQPSLLIPVFMSKTT